MRSIPSTACVLDTVLGALRALAQINIIIPIGLGCLHFTCEEDEAQKNYNTMTM